MFLCLIVFQQHDGQMGVQMLDEGFDKVEFNGCHGLFFLVETDGILVCFEKNNIFFFSLFIYFLISYLF